MQSDRQRSGRYDVSLNPHRRHLEAGQRAAIGAKMLPLLKEEARQRKLATLKQNAPTDVELIPHRGEGDAGLSRDIAANAAKVNPRYIDAAAKIQAASPAAFDAMAAGKTAMSQAWDIVHASADAHR